MSFIHADFLPFVTMNPQQQSEYVAQIDEFSVDNPPAQRGDERREDQGDGKFIDPTLDGLKQIIKICLREMNLSEMIVTDLPGRLAPLMYEKLLRLSMIEKQAIAQNLLDGNDITGEAAVQLPKRLKAQLQGTFAELRKELLFIISLAWSGGDSSKTPNHPQPLDQYTLFKLIHYHAGTAINRVHQHLDISYQITEEPVEPDKL